MTEHPPKRAGFVAILGAPNAGKSTLLNQIVGRKLSIVTPKVQTTRTRIRGVRIEGEAQLVLVDTPGIFQPRRRLDRAMVDKAWGEAAEADAVVLLIDATRGLDDDATRILDGLKSSGRKAVVAINKVDAVARATLLPIAKAIDESGVAAAVFMISALTGDGVEDLVRDLVKRLPESEWLFPEDQLSDITERFLAAEIVREQLFLKLGRELPYAATVETERFLEQKDGSARIEATIIVQKDSQKPIVLGHQGSKIKEIGQAARVELEAELERRVHLFLFVKVRKGWDEEPSRFRDMGLDFPQ
ncbi:MAG: GTPase Era [Alphaproteobacteria bacterium]|nr:GTPase Era [Alphaproteobacteria bacterium]